MAEANSTLTCQVCANTYPATVTKAGNIRKTKLNVCSRSCRDKHYYRQKCGQDKPFRKCGVSACNNNQVAKGYCSTHYLRLHKYGDPLGKKEKKRVVKSCEWCGIDMVLKPGVAKKKKTCSRICRNHAVSRAEGKAYRLKTITCECCHKHVERTVRSAKDAGRYCGKACFYKALSVVAGEREALQRIGDRRRSKERERYDTLVRPEVQALRRIARRCNDPARNITCPQCGVEARRKRPFFKFCSLSCKRETERASKEEYKQTETYKAYRRASKSRRRALLRTATADSIDPFKVFERDQWKCHLCGVKTLKSKRGTIHDRAPELEHIISLSQGGTHTWGNVACSCRKCNGAKGASSVGQLGLQIAC